MKRYLPLFVFAVLLIGGYLAYRWYQNRTADQESSAYETQVVGRGSLTATVGATGTVRSNQSVILSWLTSGTVADVSVSLGEGVSEGQVLAHLALDSLPPNVILAQVDQINAQKALEDLHASGLARAQALLAVQDAQQALIDAGRILDIFDQKDYKDDLDDAQQVVVDKKEALQEAEDDFEPYKDWDPDNEKRQDFEQKLEDAQNAYDEAVRKVDELELRKAQAQSNLEAAQARLADAQRAFERVKDGPHPDDLAAAEARRMAAQATLDQARMSAPFAGTITAVNIKTGNTVAPGTPAFRLDDLSKLMVDVQVSEVDINRVRTGEPVKLTFDAILGKEYDGTVSEVSPVGTLFQGVVEYTVTVELLNPDEDIKPGMTAAANIVVDQLDNVLLVSNRAVRVREGQRVVYIQEGDELVPVKVVLGASSDNMSQVIDGDLTAGDVVVLNPPMEFDTNGPPGFMR